MKLQSRCYIFSAGSFYGLQEKPTPDDFIIAADGGFLYCQQEHITPQLLVGDFDSLDRIPAHIPIRSFPAEKDDTDTMLAIKIGLEFGYREFHLYGCTGGRLDHTLANMQSLLYLAKHGAQAYLYGEHEICTAIEHSSMQLFGQVDKEFSVFCFGPDAKKVSIQGAKYELLHASLSASFPLGVSNRCIHEPLTISVEDGSLLISWEH